jgi:hypothetical protein
MALERRWSMSIWQDGTAHEDALAALLRRLETHFQHVDWSRPEARDTDIRPRKARKMRMTSSETRLAAPPSSFALDISTSTSMPPASPPKTRTLREVIGLINLRVMVPWFRIVGGCRRRWRRTASNRARAGREIRVICEIPNDVIQVDAFASLFDGFSIGCNDLMHLTFGVEWGSEVVAFDFNECDAGMLKMLQLPVTGTKRNRHHVGICVAAPANYPEIARFVVQVGTSSISDKPSSLLQTVKVVHAAEQEMLGRHRTIFAAGG